MSKKLKVKLSIPLPDAPINSSAAYNEVKDALFRSAYAILNDIWCDGREGGTITLDGPKDVEYTAGRWRTTNG